MKDLIVIIVIVILIFGGSYFVSKYYETSGNEIIAMIEDLSNGLETEPYDKKKEKVSRLEDEWDKRQKVWINFQYHENINLMEDNIIECCNYYITEDRKNFDISFEKIKRAIEDLKFREEITLLNIL